jgi:predicted ribosomally synthesized peptide with SipW-like signal peptide
MKKRAVLILGLALMIAAAGVVYAHWTDTLKVEATINTGDLAVLWTDVFTDDDGVGDCGEEIGDPAIWGGGIGDPADFSTCDTPALRYDKNVASCEVAAVGDGSDTFVLTINNAYPSYHCTIFSTFTNTGSVPVKVQSVETTIDPGGMVLGEDAYWHTEIGTGCGLQIDPGEEYTTVNHFHLMQYDDGDPETVGDGNRNQDLTATMDQDINFVNWNEWSADACGELPIHTP